MKYLKSILLGIFCWSWCSFPAQAWELSVKNQADQAPMVWVGNQQAQGLVDVYLLWLDMDKPQQDWFASWHVQHGWQADIHPAFDQAVEINGFSSFAVTELTPQCQSGHRCFLALLALEPGSEALDLAHWKDAAVLPLSLEASFERLPAQTVFLNRDEAATGTGGMTTTAMDGVASGAAPAPTAPATTDKSNAGEQAASTEKPDIFRLLDNHQLLYVNGRAERLQLIDVNDLTQPRLVASLALSATPRELYVLNRLYVLVQNKDYANSELSSVKQNADGQLQVVDTQAIPGNLHESRRRNERIYSVAQASSPAGECCMNYADLDINVVQIDALGNLDSIDNSRIRGYDPKIAIFSDYLVIANRDPQVWNNSLVQVFALSDARDPLVDLGAVRVSGYVPSEFHLDVRDQQLRIVYGPEDRGAGSSLGIYDLGRTGLPLIGQVNKIAPGESLFATRFNGDKAYVVTYERTDPLWVIGLSNPAKPEILGELLVPGWSEKLFFNENRLFAVGIDDQPAIGEPEGWYRRVAMSLFDVADPLKPRLLDRITPLTGQVNYSYSPALDDERALLLDWTRDFAALPVESWQNSARSTLQMVNFSQDKFLDLGLLELSVPAQRSLSLGNNNMGVMADQRFITAQWSDSSKPQVLGELELARNLGWLTKQADNLWSGGYGQDGYRYLYRYALNNLEQPAQSWTLAQNFYQVASDAAQVLFYQQSPMSVQRFDYATQKLSEAQIIEAQTPPDQALADSTGFAPQWYQRSDLLLDAEHFYLGEQRPVYFESQPPIQPKQPEAATGVAANFIKPQPYYSTEWRLRSWHWENGKAVEQPTRAIPGKPLALAQDGRLLTVEHTHKGSRLQLIALHGIWTQVLQMLDFDCTINNLHSTAQGFYATCGTAHYYYPMYLAADAAIAPASQQTRLLHLVVDPQLRIAQEWKLEGQRELLAVNQNLVLLGPDSYSGYYPLDYAVKPMLATSDMAVSGLIAPDVMSMNTQCELFSLGNSLQSVTKLASCSSAQNLVLSPNQAYFTQGFAGIKSIVW